MKNCGLLESICGSLIGTLVDTISTYERPVCPACPAPALVIPDTVSLVLDTGKSALGDL